MAAAEIRDHETGLVSGPFSWFQSRQIFHETHETEANPSIAILPTFLGLLPHFCIKKQTIQSGNQYIEKIQLTLSRYYFGFQMRNWWVNIATQKYYNRLKNSGLVVSWSLVEKIGETLGLVRLRLARKLQPLV